MKLDLKKVGEETLNLIVIFMLIVGMILMMPIVIPFQFLCKGLRRIGWLDD